MANGVPDRDLREFLKGLAYRHDKRKPPDRLRRGQFRRGWKQAMSGEPMSQRTLDHRLTWNNLGYRVGMAFGQASDAEIDDAFEGFADQFTPSPSSRPRRPRS